MLFRIMVFSSNRIDWQIFIMDYISVQNGNNLLNMSVKVMLVTDRVTDSYCLVIKCN